MSNLRYWRQERGLTQVALSELTGIPKYLIQLAEQKVRELNDSEKTRIVAALAIDEEKLNGAWGQLPLVDELEGGQAK